MTDTVNLVAIQTDEGRDKTIKSRYGKQRTIKVDRQWRVEADGVLVGFICYRMLTRERKTKGLTYVNSRWYAPGWEYAGADGRLWLERPSKKECLEELAWNASRR